MKKIHLLILSASTVFGLTQSYGVNANIGWGSALAAGGALFQGADAASADSITLGYFTDDITSGDGTGFNVLLGPDSTFNTLTGFNVGDGGSPVGGVDVTAANGRDAWILISDGALSAFIRANDWTDITGAATPSPPSTLAFTFDSADSDGTVSFLQGVGTLLTVTNNGGQGGASGIGIQLTAVPEPSSFALLAGCFGLAWVMVRRRS